MHVESTVTKTQIKKFQTDHFKSPKKTFSNTIISVVVAYFRMRFPVLESLKPKLWVASNFVAFLINFSKRARPQIGIGIHSRRTLVLKNKVCSGSNIYTNVVYCYPILYFEIVPCKCFGLACNFLIFNRFQIKFFFGVISTVCQDV